MGILGFTYNAAKAAFKGKGKVSPTITSVKSGKNLTTKRNIQDKVVKAVDEGVKKSDVPQSFKELQKTKQYASETKRKKSKEFKDYSYRLDKLTEKKATGGRVGKMGGGMMGRRFGMKAGTPKPKTNVQKIKETFAPKGLKKIDPKKQKGLAKLKKARPDVVRKMGYMKKGGRAGFKDGTGPEQFMKEGKEDPMRDRMKQPLKTIKNTKDPKRKIGSNVYRRKP